MKEVIKKDPKLLFELYSVMNENMTTDIRKTELPSFYFYIDKMDFDYIIEKNKDKAAKKMEKKKVQTEKMQQYANISTRNIDINKKSGISDAEREAALKKANEYYSKNAKPGSMAAKANMVREYNEKNTR